MPEELLDRIQAELRQRVKSSRRGLEEYQRLERALAALEDENRKNARSCDQLDQWVAHQQKAVLAEYRRFRDRARAVKVRSVVEPKSSTFVAIRPSISVDGCSGRLEYSGSPKRSLS